MMASVGMSLLEVKSFVYFAPQKFSLPFSFNLGHLISTGALSGIAVLTNTDETCILSYGKLASHSEQASPFCESFCQHVDGYL